jgi:hypothetical protein
MVPPVESIDGGELNCRYVADSRGRGKPGVVIGPDPIKEDRYTD